jgi:fluoride ion exporter CrcB/FEX
MSTPLWLAVGLLGGSGRWAGSCWTPPCHCGWDDSSRRGALVVNASGALLLGLLVGLGVGGRGCC